MKKTSPPNSSQEILVKQYFEDQCGHWDDIYTKADLISTIIQQRLAYVLACVDRLGLKPGSRALDLGCGAGAAGLELGRRGFTVVGVDVSEQMIERARQNWYRAGRKDGADFRVGNAEELEFGNGSFDLVIALGLIEYLRWDRRALREMRRVLKPGGHLIVTAPNKIRLAHLSDPFWLTAFLNRKLRKSLKRVLMRVGGGGIIARRRRIIGSGATGPAFHRNLYVPSRLKETLAALDFEVLQALTHGFGPLWPLRRFPGLSVRLNRKLTELSTRPARPRLGGSGNDLIVLCRKRDQSLPFNQRAFFNTIKRTVKEFRASNREVLSRLDLWLNAHPEYRRQELQPLKTRSWAGGNALVISPHPDDEIIGCGGTVITMIAEGVPVVVLQLTDGSNTTALHNYPEAERSTIRLREARAVAEELGFAELILWKERDSRLECTPEKARRLAELLERVRPQIIFVPFINDPHPDHVAANRILRESLLSCSLLPSEMSILSYEVWSLVPPNCFRFIDRQFNRKSDVLIKYRTGMSRMDYADYCQALHSYRAYTLLGVKAYIETFLKLAPEEYIELIRRFQEGGRKRRLR